MEPGDLHEKATTTVVVGEFDPLTQLGLHASLLSGGVHILAGAVPDQSLLRTVMGQKPQVVIVSSTIDYKRLVRVQSHVPEVGIVVVAHRPTEVHGVLFLEAGMSCIAHNVTVNDMLVQRLSFSC